MENQADPVQVDAVKTTIRHLRNAVEDENYKPKRNLDDVLKEQLERLSAPEEVTVEGKPADNKADDKKAAA